jgi:DNA invertase Pin-like site-specific DNA recombinase
MSTPAAQYVRMSTDQQSLSIEVQKVAIREYAREHGIEIVRTFEDYGKSGLSLEGRPAMQELLKIAGGKGCPFKLILVLDVSRWGRFQDPDEAGYHEFHCRRNGVKVLYVTHPTEIDSSPFSGLLKHYRRAAAADYSRDLGIKCRAGIVHVVKLGYAAGCLPCLGYRRRAVSSAGVSKGLLLPHERKPLLTDRVRWELGPPEEVAVVQKMFRDFIAGASICAITRGLVGKGVMGHNGKPMTETRVQNILKNEVVTGRYEWGGPSKRYTSATNIPPLAEGIRNDHVPAIIDASTWEAAQARCKAVKEKRWGLSAETLIERLAAALGQEIVMVVAPRRSSMRMSGKATSDGAGSATGMKEAPGNGAAPSRARRRHLCTTLALMPWDIATLATDAAGRSHSLSTCALSSAL